MYNVNYTRNHDLEQIHIHEYFEVEHWTKALNISREELARAVAVVGTSANAVKRYLEREMNEPAEIRRQA
jgi:hypothetical protein